MTNPNLIQKILQGGTPPAGVRQLVGCVKHDGSPLTREAHRTWDYLAHKMSVLYWFCVALLGSWLGRHADAQSDNITSDTYFYGQSPPVYPTPPGTGTGTWAGSYAKAKLLVGQMTQDEKISLTFGVPGPNSCSGNIPSIGRLNFPGLCLQDAGNGVRETDFVNAYPAGIHVGASWNKNLAYQRGLAMGGEFRAKGVNVALGPVVGPLGRVAQGGRNWEGFASDPYLCGVLAAESVRGIQEKGVITSTKHFIGNEQETNRNPSFENGHQIESLSSNIDDKTMHELYLWPFQDAIRAGSGNIMCSYQRINNSYGCANSKILNGLLKTELGFQGFVVSDWFAQHGGYATALAGLDMAMPNSFGYFQGGLLQAVTNGSVPQSKVDDMATRIIATWYQMKQDTGFPPLGVGLAQNLLAPHKRVDARDPASKPTLLNGAIEGHVLVKNTNNALPLKSPKLLSLFGYSAKAQDTHNIGTSWTFGYEPQNASALSFMPAIAPFGTLITGGGSGANSPSVLSSPFDGIAQRAYEANTALLWDFVNTGGTAVVDVDSDACLVFINAWASEGWDRPGVNDTYSDKLVNNIADQCNNTIVVIHNAGERVVDNFISHPNVTALIFAHLPGQDSGRALAAILYGDVPPSGKLPYTVAKSPSDYGDLLEPSMPEGKYIYFPQSDFTEGVYIDYRAFDKAGITPRYEFGFGLTYTTFNYSNLNIVALQGVNTQPYPRGPILQGGATDLWDVLATVTADITNTGKVDGQEVAQLYVGIPGGPVRQLRGFSKVGITVGSTVQVHFDLLRRDLSEWDTTAQMWKLQSGQYKIYVGASSRIIPLQGTLTI